MRLLVTSLPLLEGDLSSYSEDTARQLRDFWWRLMEEALALTPRPDAFLWIGEPWTTDTPPPDWILRLRRITREGAHVFLPLRGVPNFLTFLQDLPGVRSLLPGNALTLDRVLLLFRPTGPPPENALIVEPENLRNLPSGCFVLGGETRDAQRVPLQLSTLDQLGTLLSLEGPPWQIQESGFRDALQRRLRSIPREPALRYAGGLDLSFLLQEPGPQWEPQVRRSLHEGRAPQVVHAAACLLDYLQEADV